MDPKLPEELGELISLPAELVDNLELSHEEERTGDYAYPRTHLLRRIQKGRPFRRTSSTKLVRRVKSLISFFNRIYATILGGTSCLLLFRWLTGFPAFFPFSLLLGLFLVLALGWIGLRVHHGLRGRLLSAFLSLFLSKEELQGPVDWVWFWESYLRSKIEDRKARIQFHMREIETMRLHIEEQMRSDPDLGDDPGLALEWKEVGSSLARSVKAFRALEKVEGELRGRIREIRALRARGKKLQKDRMKEKSRQRKVQNLKSQTERILEDWDKEEMRIREDLQALEGEFQDRLLWARDYLQALEDS